MKYIITESQFNILFKRRLGRIDRCDESKTIVESNLKKFLKNQFGFDLTGNVEMITSSSQVPYQFDKCISSTSINRDLNRWGPMYLIKSNNGDDMFLVQDRGKESVIMSNFCYDISEKKFFEMIGMKHIMSIMDLINEYLTEEE